VRERGGALLDFWVRLSESKEGEFWLIERDRSARTKVSQQGEEDESQKVRSHTVAPSFDGNLDQDLTVVELADIACMSVGHFTRSFRAATGRAPHAFVAERRLMLAKCRLRDERCSIEEIAFSAGFSSLANFSKAFRHSTGLSPSQFKARS